MMYKVISIIETDKHGVTFHLQAVRKVKKEYEKVRIYVSVQHLPNTYVPMIGERVNIMLNSKGAPCRMEKVVSKKRK